MKARNLTRIFVILGTWLGVNLARAQHGHLNAGAAGTTQNSKLYFDNGADFVTSSGYVKTLNFTNSARFAGYYEGGITLTALPVTPASGGPTPNAPALGSFIRFAMSSLSGPPGGSFGFWEGGSTNPTLSLLPGEASTNLFPLSQGDGSPGSDPFGHIHGRRFTATKPGLYTIGFSLFDTSANGTNHGPIHTPSDMLPVYFQAGVTITSLTRTNNVATVTYGSITNRSFILEYSTNLSDVNGWKQVSAALPGTDLLQSQNDPGGTAANRFYRLKITTP
jgi:hypothetical protein